MPHPHAAAAHHHNLLYNRAPPHPFHLHENNVQLGSSGAVPPQSMLHSPVGGTGGGTPGCPTKPAAFLNPLHFLAAGLPPRSLGGLSSHHFHHHHQDTRLQGGGGLGDHPLLAAHQRAAAMLSSSSSPLSPHHHSPGAASYFGYDPRGVAAAGLIHGETPTLWKPMLNLGKPPTPPATSHDGLPVVAATERSPGSEKPTQHSEEIGEGGNAKGSQGSGQKAVSIAGLRMKAKQFADDVIMDTHSAKIQSVVASS